MAFLSFALKVPLITPVIQNNLPLLLVLNISGHEFLFTACNVNNMLDVFYPMSLTITS